MNGLKFERCTVEDTDALARNNVSAFWEESIWRMIWPKGITREFMIVQLTKRMPKHVLLRDRDRLRHLKAIDFNTGAIVGYARWVLPESRLVTESHEVEWADAQVPDVSSDQKQTFEDAAQTAWWVPREDMDELDSRNMAVRDRILAKKAYLELDYVAVHPDHKGKGIATALIEHGIRQAEKMGLDIFVFAFKSALGIYLRLGFKEVERIIQDDSAFGGTGEYGAYFMVYEVSRVALKEG